MKRMKHMSQNALDDLIEALDLGLGIVTRVWLYPAKNWVTKVFAIDIDQNGEPEIIVCSRDGRVRLFSKTGELLWERIIWGKIGVETGIVTGDVMGEIENAPRIIVGTRDGKVYVLDRFGHTMMKDGTLLAFDSEGQALDPEREAQAYWHDTGSAIRQIFVDPRRPDEILIGSQDRCAYGVDYKTGKLLWRFPTEGWVRAICSGDVNGDGQDEILVGSVDRHLYLLDRQGNMLTSYPILHPVQSFCMADVDNDEQVEVLVATEGKDLVALNYIVDAAHPGGYFKEKWHRPFGNRLLSLCVVDIDGDGKQEIIAGSEDQHIYFLDDEGKLIWRHNHRSRVFSLYPCDIDNNGLPELLVGSTNDRASAMRIRLRKGIDRRVRRAYKQLGEPNPEGMDDLTSDHRVLLLDILNRNNRQFVTLQQSQEQLDTRVYKEALSTLSKLEQQKVERFWQKDIAYIRTICLRHIIDEQIQEIVVGTSTGDIHDFSADGKSSWSKQLHDHIVDVQTGFVDRRRQEEIIICTSDRQQIYIVDGPQKNKQRQLYVTDSWMSSLCVTSPDLQGVVEIIVGSEDRKLYIYRGDSQEPVDIISTAEGVRLVRANTQLPGHTPQIVTASLSNRVYAYTRHGKYLWHYKTQDRIQAVCIKDINQDGRVEVLIGSEDRNIHVVDTNGHLLWRYYLPHRVLAVDATENDGNIFVGCADGKLYVFSKDGDLLWTYQAKDRIHALCVADIDNDGLLEIVLGTEDQLDVLRMVNQQRIYEMMEHCWKALQPGEQVTEDLLSSTDPFLQIFALRKLVGRGNPAPRDFDRLENLAKKGAAEVRKALVPTVMTLYPFNPARARALLFQLSTDPEQEVRSTLIEHIQMLIDCDWDLGFNYLKRAAYDPDRYMRRLVLRELYALADSVVERPLDTRKETFKLLLDAMQDKDSEWIRQEAARSMAHLLNQHYGKLIVSLHLFIVKQIPRNLWEQITHGISNPDVRNYLTAVIEMVFDLNEENAPEKILQVVNALQATRQFDYGLDIQHIYGELYRLFTIQTVAGIANYRCKLSSEQFGPGNEFAHIILEVFNKLGIISRPLRMYLWREGVQDQQASLQETLTTIEQMRKFIDQQYTHTILGEPIAALPDHHAFLFLLDRWSKLVQEKLDELRGTADLQVELQTKDTHYDNQIGIWLNVKNAGRGVATAIRITLLRERDNQHFHVVGNNCVDVDALLPQEEITVEFTIEPHCMQITLKFDIAYDDTGNTPQVESFEDCLTLRETYREFHYIPNFYSTGTPTPDSRMFYGRDKDMAFLQDNLTRAARSVIVLYGQRRSGKTTILLQLANNPSILGEHIPVLIDMQRISYIMSIDTLLHRMAYFIGQAMRKRSIPFGDLPALENFKADPTHAFDLFLDVIEEQLGDRKLILMIDEFEVLEDLVDKGKLQPEIFDYLRDIVQHRQYINFLFSGTHKITEYTRRYRSVFFNTALHHKLSRLTLQAAEGLIQKPVEGYLEYEPLTVKKIHQLTADQPYLIHLMCRAIVDYCNERGKTFVTINDVNTVLREVMQTGQFHFEWLWGQIAAEEQLVLAALAEGGQEEGRWLSLTEIEEIYSSYSVRYKREHILDSLKSLIEQDFVENKASSSRKNLLDSDKFRIPVGLTRSWLLKEHPLEVVRKQMGD
ncbi:MAG TPA: PQQ-binding-like beta-propeller repeat protein [Ktedonobacteraceae bacterium]|nr:PQQ-binding-like beta-propeller repeat protein [Ktedonobacteraceae bacterium]